jgi:hypothetical protein
VDSIKIRLHDDRRPNELEIEMPEWFGAMVVDLHQIWRELHDINQTLKQSASHQRTPQIDVVGKKL